MPGLDRTGPQGAGSRTGRSQGKCRNSLSKDEIQNDEISNAGFAGFGSRRRRRRGGQGPSQHKKGRGSGRY